MIATTANIIAMMRITATTDPPMMTAVGEDTGQYKELCSHIDSSHWGSSNDTYIQL